jgi:hypothetical protein
MMIAAASGDNTNASANHVRSPRSRSSATTPTARHSPHHNTTKAHDAIEPVKSYVRNSAAIAIPITTAALRNFIAPS